MHSIARYLPIKSIMTRASSSTVSGPVSNVIIEKLTEAFAPSHLEVRNESYMHNVPANSETHFKVIIISSHFTSKTPIVKHRLVNNVLKQELDGPVHALSIVAMDPKKWEEYVEKNGGVIEKSPSCRGGDGSLPKKGED